MKIVSINLRSVYGGDGINSFIHRAVPLYDKIAEEKPDVVGFQEVVEGSLNIIERLFGNEYIFAGQLRNEDFKGEGLYTMIRKESCQLLGFETIWLSPTPYVPGSRFENQSKFPRICLQALVRHKESGERFRIFNVHLDHISEEAKVLGVKMTLDFLESYRERDGFPVVLLGDFNAHPDSETIKICKSFKDLKEVSEDIEVTFHKYGKEARKIDYIFMSQTLADRVKNTKIWDNERNGIYLSDHYPVATELDTE